MDLGISKSYLKIFHFCLGRHKNIFFSSVNQICKMAVGRWAQTIFDFFSFESEVLSVFQTRALKLLRGKAMDCLNLKFKSIFQLDGLSKRIDIFNLAFEQSISIIGPAEDTKFH